MGYSPQGHKDWDTTERLHFHFQDSQGRQGVSKSREKQLKNSEFFLSLSLHFTYLFWPHHATCRILVP